MTGVRKSKFNLCLMAITVLLVAVSALISVLLNGGSVAFADGGIHFEISFDGTDWILQSDEREIAKAQGDFFDPQNDDAVSVIFKRAIDKTLVDENATEYSLNFNLPDIGFTTIGSSVFDYTEKTSGFVIRGIYSPIISNDVIEALQYCKDDGEFENYNFAVQSNGGLAFGQQADVGSYRVRFTVQERFTFDGRVYIVPRYSEYTTCTVEKATPDTPNLGEVSVEYGTRTADIADILPSMDGTWAISAEQTEGAITNGNDILHTRDDAYSILFDFTPRNQNYKTLEGVSVRVKIIPRTLRIVINDVFSLLGDPIVTDFTYSILTPLADGDSIDGLGVEIDSSAVDKDVAGEYVLTTTFRNPDYIAYSMNADNVFVGGGLYTVYATSLSATAPDGTEFTLLGTGFKYMTLRIELCKNKWTDTGFDVPMEERAYRFIFENPRGERVYPAERYTVTWQKGALNGAKYACVVLRDESVSPLFKLEDSFITVDKNTDVIVFYIEIEKDGLSAFELASIALSVLIVLSFVVLFIIIAKRKRISSNISAEIIKNDVYTRENDVLNGNSDGTNENKVD